MEFYRTRINPPVFLCCDIIIMIAFCWMLHYGECPGACFNKHYMIIRMSCLNFVDSCKLCWRCVFYVNLLNKGYKVFVRPNMYHKSKITIQVFMLTSISIHTIPHDVQGKVHKRCHSWFEWDMSYNLLFWNPRS